MKILAIRGKNLASLEQEFEIDFQAEPLKSSGLFAIVGATGAGKSTILDAICLALYDNVPRFLTAENVTVSDSADNVDSITPKDPRNILHKGAIEGFAEVDFKALDGKDYRARWSVRRARNKADGALQPSVMSLYNLSSNQDVQGKKTDIKPEIEKLLGLTFSQFTRAVLLAQGDFENFIKAKQSDKAELLEKLTGTDIYSQISIRIFEEYGIAKNNVYLLRKQIEGIEILDETQILEIENKQKLLDRENNKLKEQIDLLAKQQRWWKEELNLLEKIRQIEQDSIKIEQEFQQNSERISYLELLNTCQEIRETYLECKRLKINSQELQLHISKSQRECELIATSNETTNQQLNEFSEKLENLESRYKEAKPKLDRAKELDFQIQSLTSSINDMEQELKKIETQIKTESQQLEQIDGLQKELRVKLEFLKIWFEDKKDFKLIVENNKSILHYIQTCNTLQDMVLSDQTSLKLVQSGLLVKQEEWNQSVLELKKLNETQPSEIIVLRENLTEGSPCPVCGSLEHPYTTLADQSITLKQEELEKRKKMLQSAIEEMQTQMEKTRSNILKIQTNIDNHTETLSANEKWLAGFLGTVVSDWKTLLYNKGNKNLYAFVENIVKQWNDNLLLQEKSETSLNTNEIQYSSVKTNLTERLKDIEIKKKNKEEKQSNLLKYKEERASIFNGESIQLIESKYDKQKQDLQNQIETQRASKNKNEQLMASLNAVITEQKQQIANNNLSIQSSNKSIEEWHVEHPNILPLMLDELCSRKMDWIAAERKYVETLTNQKIAVDTALKERKQDREKHQQSEDKPDITKNQEAIVSEINLLAENQKNVGKELIDTEFRIKKQIESKDQIARISKELTEKEELFTQWEKLSSLLGSSTGDKFKRIAQGYTLDILLDYANVHLKNLNERYILQKVPNSLVLQVVDKDMFEEVRPIHSLSGGESFLIALALALGLSSLSSNQMNIESLFIDEGFGALDLDTLSVAMGALENLQMQGRKIGVISHVENMKERITTQIQVLRTANAGSSTIKIVG